jgi:hypothetical protein
MVNNLLHSWYSFYLYLDTGTSNLYTELFPKLGQSLINLAGFFFFFAGISLLSVRGLFSVAAIIGTFLLFWMVSKSLCQAKIQSNSMIYPAEFQFMATFFIVSASFNIFIFVIIGNEIVDRYFILFMVLYIPLIAFIFEHAEKNVRYLKRMSIIMGIILFILGQSCLNFQKLTGINVNSDREGYIQYLLNNELHYGFATFWNANVTTELTNGKIEMNNLHLSINEFRVYNFLTPMKFKNISYHYGESFLLLTDSEWKHALRTERLFAQIKPDYEDKKFIVIKYPSAKIIHNEVLDD